MRFATTLLATSFLVFTSWGARADPSFIRQFLAAKGGCTFELDYVLTGGGVQAPFGKPAEQWTDADLARLPAELARCQAEADETGNKFTSAQVARTSRDIAARVPDIVRRGRVEDQREKERQEARTALANQDVAQANSDLDRLRNQADAAEAEAARAKIDAQSQQQSLQKRLQLAEATIARARTQSAQLQAETERKEREAAEAQAQAQPQPVPQDTAPQNTAPLEAAPSAEARGFKVPSGTELLPRLLGNGQAALKPRQTQTQIVNNLRTTTYLLGPSTVVAISEDATSQVVQNFGVYLAGSGSSELGIGLYVLMNAIDVVNPGLDQNGRDDVLEPMVDAVVKSGTTYDVKLAHAQMHCRPVDGRALCAFGQIESSR